MEIIENAKPRSTLYDMIAEAHSIREVLVDRQMSNSVEARQHQVHPEETDDDEHLNSRTIKEFPPDTGTLVPDRAGGDLDNADYGTLVPDSGTMVELESNLGTMVINSDSEDSTMKSEYLRSHKWQLYLFELYLHSTEHDTNPDKPKYRPQFLDHFDRKKTEAINNMVASEAAAAAAAENINPSAPPIEQATSESPISPAASNGVHLQQQSPMAQIQQFHAPQKQFVQTPQQQFSPQQQYVPHVMHHGMENNLLAAHQHQPQYHVQQQQHIDIALNSEFVSSMLDRVQHSTFIFK